MGEEAEKEIEDLVGAGEGKGGEGRLSPRAWRGASILKHSFRKRNREKPPPHRRKKGERSGRSRRKKRTRSQEGLCYPN